MSIPKEPRFFSNVDRRPAYAGPGDAEGVNAAAITDIEQYTALFADGADSQMLGEATTTYLTDPQACRALASSEVKNPRFIALVRNPIERALSCYLYKVNQGLEPEPTFVGGLDREAERIEQNWSPIWHYTQRGLYMPGITRFVDAFGRDAVRVVTYDELTTNSAGVLSGLRDFLELDEPFPVTQGVHYNAASRASRSVRPTLPNIVHPAFNKLKLTEQSQPSATSVRLMKRDVFDRLAVVFEDDVRQLQEFLSTDLSHWLRPQ